MSPDETPIKPTRILTRDQYHCILSRLRELPPLSVPHFRNLSTQCSIHEGTVSSIYYNDWSTKVIKAAAEFRRLAPALLKRYIDGTILDLPSLGWILKCVSPINPST